jgi:hypothetical protein
MIREIDIKLNALKFKRENVRRGEPLLGHWVPGDYKPKNI